MYQSAIAASSVEAVLATSEDQAQMTELVQATTSGGVIESVAELADSDTRLVKSMRGVQLPAICGVTMTYSSQGREE